jgi:ferredoxin
MPMPAKVIVDFEKCTGHARCATVAPEVYVLDETGYNAMGTFNVTPGLEETARRGALACPERAIAFVPDPEDDAGKGSA